MNILCFKDTAARLKLSLSLLNNCQISCPDLPERLHPVHGVSDYGEICVSRPSNSLVSIGVESWSHGVVETCISGVIESWSHVVINS